MNRDNFGNRFGVLVAMAGSAVGLGNLWRFPFLVGTNGGAAFILIYLVFCFFLCLPIMYSEFLIGRRGQANAFGAVKKLAPGEKWGIIGILGVLASFVILSFYSVVGGWTIDYICKSLTFTFHTTDYEELNNLFQQSVSTTKEPIIFMLVFLLISGLVVLAGVKKGIEKYTKVMMPLLFLMVIAIAIRSATLPNAKAGLDFLFRPDFSKVTSETVLAALGQAFFSLSIGCGCILTYGSYVKKDENIIATSASTAAADGIFAIIAGIAIMPAVFSFGISPSEGPGLVFVTLPIVFAQMPLGNIIAIAFFFILFIAAITSSISLLEVIVAFCAEELKIKRKLAVVLTVIAIGFFAVLCSLSQGVLSGVKIFGMNIFDLFDNLSSNILMPLGGLLVVIFVGWRMKKEDYLDEITNSHTLKISNLLVIGSYYIIKFIAPLVITIVMLDALL